ncbi:Phage protein (N4 Gp49/phage Sf6 gene 66) family [uncultured Caudovirales phage]|uniref:Phage protein (N4 Gp49/phage Sf6 gene 66) family n=1 Tax=uncultured Caudovirales phage TaxID=2100421 RepID=A0A6J5KJJ7_9CAUD|nr:Phage protein (N4 Gp49/phage Sf6 gene 66) family [uncultured Caudovirales phage]
MLTEEKIEARLQARGISGPRLKPQDIDDLIVAEAFHVFPGTTITVACLTLTNGFNLVGQSASISLENFDEVIGRDIARRNARDKIWQLEGYRVMSEGVRS